jgi:cupin fold WbuC family metalloprotein
MKVKTITRHLLAELSRQARTNARQRQNWNLHPSDDFCCHRLLNAMEPDSYIRPHRHLATTKDETFVILSGRLGVVLFDENGAITETVLLAAGGEVCGADVPHGLFHTAVSLAPDTVFLEAKAGPYLPLIPEELAAWAPVDGSVDAAAYLAGLKGLFSAGPA